MRDPGDFKTLDRPVWHALTGRQARLAVATGAAVRIDPAYGPFAALRDGSDEAVVALRCALAGPDDAVGLVERERRAPTPGLQSLREATLVQMVATKPAPVEDDPCIVLLGEADAPEMTELALATEPGPWGAATHRYGNFFGIRIDGRLAAMAGERMLLPELAEVSAVCTWPEFRGQGLAAALVHRVVRGFAARRHAVPPHLRRQRGRNPALRDARLRTALRNGAFGVGAGVSTVETSKAPSSSEEGVGGGAVLAPTPARISLSRAASRGIVGPPQ